MSALVSWLYIRAENRPTKGRLTANNGSFPRLLTIRVWYEFKYCQFR